jgi:hypothetical protein
MLNRSSMVRFLACLVVFCSLWLAPEAALAREPRLSVSIITLGPGDPTFSKFGHNAILVKNKRTGHGLVYNYGTFTFSSPNLVSDFLNRRLNYWLSVEPFEELLKDYSAWNRTILEQELAFTEQQALELARFLANNARPENRLYAYDYYTDNCSTRVRDALDRALGGALKAAARPEGSQTYREHSLRLTADDLPLYIGLDFGLSGYADQPVGEWEEAFLPEKLAQIARRARVKNAQGELVPLVTAEKVHFRAQRAEPLSTPPSRTLAFAIVGALVGALFTWLGRRRTQAWARRVHASLLIVVGLVTGIGGSLLAFLWLGTPHTAAARNVNVLTAPPWALLLIPLGVLLLRRHAHAERLTRWISGVLVAGTVIALAPVAAGVQHSERFVALLLPLWLGVLAGFVEMPRFSRAVAK